MAWIGPETVTIIKHLIGNFMAAVVLLFAAIGLAMLEKWCAKNDMPVYLCTGASVIAFVLFACDGIVICGTALIVSLRLLRKTAKDESNGV